MSVSSLLHTQTPVDSFCNTQCFDTRDVLMFPQQLSKAATPLCCLDMSCYRQSRISAPAQHKFLPPVCVHWRFSRCKFTAHPKKYTHDSCFVVVWYHLILPISFRVTSLALGQSYDCPSACEVILKNMGKPIQWNIMNYDITETKPIKTMCIFHGIYCVRKNCGTYCEKDCHSQRPA